MYYTLNLFVFVSSVILSWLIIPRILVISYKKKLFDIPNERKVHTELVPRLGGISFFPILLISLVIVIGVRYLFGYGFAPERISFIVPEFCFLICGLTILYLTGVKDDLIGLRYRAKFIIQFLVATLFPLSGLWLNNLHGVLGIYEISPWFGIPLTILLTVFILNAINLIDGIDGLASGLSIAALLVLGWLYIRLDMWIYTTLAFSALGILVSFFYYNVFGKQERRQKIFMGDTGSLTLGYILAFLAIRYSFYNPNFAPYSEGAIVAAFSTLIVPMFDVIRVMFIRLKHGKGLFVPDKNHIHHKCLKMGLSPRKAMICILAIACGFSVANILLIPYVDNNLLLVGDALGWIGIHLLFSRIQDRKSKKTLMSGSPQPVGYNPIIAQKAEVIE